MHHVIGLDSVVDITTSYGLVSNPDGGGSFSARTRTGPGAHPAFNTIGTEFFPEVKQPGRGVNHPPPPSAEVKERGKLHLYSPNMPPWLFWGGMRNSPQWASSFTRFLDHTQRRTTVSGRVISLSKDHYLTTQHSQQTNIHDPEGFEPTVSAGERP